MNGLYFIKVVKVGAGPGVPPRTVIGVRGIVLGGLTPDRYLCKFRDKRTPAHIRVVSLDQMAEWCFFETEEEVREFLTAVFGPAAVTPGAVPTEINGADLSLSEEEMRRAMEEPPLPGEVTESEEPKPN